MQSLACHLRDAQVRLEASSRTSLRLWNTATQFSCVPSCVPPKSKPYSSYSPYINTICKAAFTQNAPLLPCHLRIVSAYNRFQKPLIHVPPCSMVSYRIPPCYWLLASDKALALFRDDRIPGASTLGFEILITKALVCIWAGWFVVSISYRTELTRGI